MPSRTTEMLKELEEFSWLSRAGVKEGSSVLVVVSWPEAIEQMNSLEWEDLRLDSLNSIAQA
jgi:hypothetical protein